MKKYIFVAFVVFAVFSSVRCDSSKEVIENVKSKHVKNLLTKNKEQLDEGLEKIEEQCPGASEKLKQAVKSYIECAEKVDDSLTICQRIQSATLNCTAPLLQVVDDCIPPKARGLPTLGLKSLVSLADFLCKQSGESIFELANPCLWEDDEANENQDNECEDKFFNAVDKVDEAIEQKDTNKIPTQTEICNTITGFRSCFQRNIGTSCKNQKTKDVIIGVFDALVAPCSHINEV